MASFFAFDPSFGGGVRVAAEDTNGDGFADIVVGSGIGASHVVVVDATHTTLPLCVTNPRSDTLISIIVPLVMTPRFVYI